MYKIAVIGEYDSIYGFAALGLDTFPVSDPEEAKTKLQELAEGSYAVIYITEALAALLKKEIEKYREMLLPAIIQIPGVSGNSRWSRQLARIFSLDRKIRKVGDLFK